MSVPSQDAGGTIHIESISDARGGKGGRPSSFFLKAGTGGEDSDTGCAGAELSSSLSGRSMSRIEG